MSKKKPGKNRDDGLSWTVGEEEVLKVQKLTDLLKAAADHPRLRPNGAVLLLIDQIEEAVQALYDAAKK